MGFDFDVEQAAAALLRLHGDGAAAVAVKRADLRMLCGDPHGMLIWRLIGQSIEEETRHEIGTTSADASTTVHE